MRTYVYVDVIPTLKAFNSAFTVLRVSGSVFACYGSGGMPGFRSEGLGSGVVGFLGVKV